MRLVVVALLLLLFSPLRAQEQVRMFPVAWLTGKEPPVYFMVLHYKGPSYITLRDGPSVQLVWTGQEQYFEKPPYTPLMGEDSGDLHTMYLLYVTPETLREIAKAPVILLRIYLDDGTVQSAYLRDIHMQVIREFVEAHLGRSPERA